MNVFERYIENVKQNKELTEIINDLCRIHFIHSEPYIESLWGHKFIEFVRCFLQFSLKSSTGSTCGSSFFCLSVIWTSFYMILKLILIYI